jgi:hypothetical protein
LRRSACTPRSARAAFAEANPRHCPAGMFELLTLPIGDLRCRGQVVAGCFE